jgi:hypothetical protein
MLVKIRYEKKNYFQNMQFPNKNIIVSKSKYYVLY